MIITIVLTMILSISFITDLRQRRILNIITLPAMLFGIVYYVLTQGFQGFLFSGAGFLVGLGVLLIPYLMGGMGAGDVKLMTAVGALTGVSFVFYTFVYSALIGGVVAVFILLKDTAKGHSIKSFMYSLPLLKSNVGSFVLGKGKKSNMSFPYGVAIVIGAACTALLRQGI